MRYFTDIYQYTEGEMTASEKKRFEIELEKNQLLKKEYEEHQLVQRGLSTISANFGTDELFNLIDNTPLRDSPDIDKLSSLNGNALLSFAESTPPKPTLLSSLYLWLNTYKWYFLSILGSIILTIFILNEVVYSPQQIELEKVWLAKDNARNKIIEAKEKELIAVKGQLSDAIAAREKLRIDQEVLLQKKDSIYIDAINTMKNSLATRVSKTPSLSFFNPTWHKYQLNGLSSIQTISYLEELPFFNKIDEIKFSTAYRTIWNTPSIDININSINNLTSIDIPERLTLGELEQLLSPISKERRNWFAWLKKLLSFKERERGNLKGEKFRAPKDKDPVQAKEKQPIVYYLRKLTQVKEIKEIRGLKYAFDTKDRIESEVYGSYIFQVIIEEEYLGKNQHPMNIEDDTNRKHKISEGEKKVIKYENYKITLEVFEGRRLGNKYPNVKIVVEEI